MAIKIPLPSHLTVIPQSAKLLAYHTKLDIAAHRTYAGKVLLYIGGKVIESKDPVQDVSDLRKGSDRQTVEWARIFYGVHLA